MRIFTATPSSRRPKRCGGARHALCTALACSVLLATATACEHGAERKLPGAPGAASAYPGKAVGTRLPGVGDTMWKRVPARTRQAVVVYGDGPDSPDSLVALYQKQGSTWRRTASWPAHNGRRGWTTDHHIEDELSPVGVFSLTDAGGSLKDPGSRLRYWRDDNAYESMLSPGEDHAHDFDYVIAIDYNRLKGVPPFDWSRPDGVEKGGGIWIHMDHGDGTSACVTVPESGMKTLLRTLDPAQHPVVVMGDRQHLAS